jgi:hypothetical protein
MNPPRLTSTTLTCVLALALSAGPGVVDGAGGLLACRAGEAILPAGGGSETSEGRSGGDCCRTQLPEPAPFASRGQLRTTAQWWQQIRPTAWHAEPSPLVGERKGDWHPGSTCGTLQGLSVRLNI